MEGKSLLFFFMENKRTLAIVATTKLRGEAFMKSNLYLFDIYNIMYAYPGACLTGFTIHCYAIVEEDMYLPKYRNWIVENVTARLVS